METNFCCEEFKKQAADPENEGFAQQFERDNEGDWNVGGCCGGGCYVVRKMKFCPYCGAAL